MTDKGTSKTPQNWNWFQARLRTKLWTSGAFIIGLLVILGVWVGSAFPWWNASHYITEYTPNPEQVLRNLVWLFGSIFGGFIAVLGFVNAIHRTQQKDRELDAAEARLDIEQTSERRKTDAEIFAKSVEQLGHSEMAIRLGGLYSLENLARSAQALPLDTDNKAYLNSLLETLAAFVRMRAPIPLKEEQNKDDKVAMDVEAAIWVISRTFGHELRAIIKAEVDLRKCYFPRLEMPSGADMQGFNLHYSQLPSARLSEANLTAAMLMETDWTKAWLFSINLTASWLHEANLTKANLDRANLTEALLIKTNMTGVVLDNPIDLVTKPMTSAIWDPNSPPNFRWSKLPEELQTFIQTRTKEIRDGRLWEKYLERQKMEKKINNLSSRT